jgi:hypothetical protein
MKFPPARSDALSRQPSLILFSLGLMLRSLFIPFMFASAITCWADPPAHRAWTSPDGRWLMACDCKGTWQSDSCRIALSRLADKKVFFTHQTSDRYIKAVWSSDSSRCILLDAPDNANSYLWLFRVEGREVATEKLDYETITHDIEAAVPATHREEPNLTRSGIETLEWISSSELRLHITYNNTSVVVVADVAEPSSPKFHVLPHNET